MSEVKTVTLIVDGNLSTSALDTRSMSVKGTLEVGNATDGYQRPAEALDALIDTTQVHIDNPESHLLGTDATEFRSILSKFTFPEEGDPIPTAPTPPPLPNEALRPQFFNTFFAGRCQTGEYKAPGNVFVSRVPYAVLKNPTDTVAAYLWTSMSAAVNDSNNNRDDFDAASLPAKLMDNAGLQHECSTDTVENVDDYNGRRWVFWWGHANYVKDEFGTKHVTAIKGSASPGHVFDKKKNTCAFGPKFWFFVKPEKYQFTDYTGRVRWTTDTGEEDGQPFTQLWGISDSRWTDLSEDRRLELQRHGIGQQDFHIWPECLMWDKIQQNYVERPYWCHAAYFAGAQNADGTGDIVSIANLPLRRNNLSYQYLNAAYGAAVSSIYPGIGCGGSACVQGFGILFDIVKNAEKSSQVIHAGLTGMSSSSSATLITYKAVASYATATPGYIFPIDSNRSFEKHCSVYMDSRMFVSATNTNYRGLEITQNGSSPLQQVGRITAIEERTFDALVDGNVQQVTAMCLVIDPDTVEPFVTRLTETECAALVAEGEYAACYVQQGFALAGETNAVIGLHDGSCVSNTNGRHPYRVQGTEYAAGAWEVFSDTVGLKGNGTDAVVIDGKEYIPDDTKCIIFHCPGTTKRITGTATGYLTPSHWVNAGYEAVGFTPADVSGYSCNAYITPEGVPLVTMVGYGAGADKGTGDYYYQSANPAEFLSGGYVDRGASSGSSYLYLYYTLGYNRWQTSARD